MNNHKIQYIITGEKDIPDLMRVMTRAFDDDALTYLGESKGGPPGYDDGKFFRKWMLLRRVDWLQDRRRRYRNWRIYRMGFTGR